jgi:hypothetical protein
MENIDERLILTHIRNFVRVVTSDDLWYDFASSNVKTDEELAVMERAGRPSRRQISSNSALLPVFGDVQRAITYWIPEMERYLEKRNHENRLLGLLPDLTSPMPDAQLLRLIEERNLSGRDLLSLCAVSSRMNDICMAHQRDLFLRRIEREFPRYETDNLNGNEREAYEILMSGKRINRIDLNQTRPFIDLDFSDFGSVISASIGEDAYQNNNLFAFVISGGILMTCAQLDEHTSLANASKLLSRNFENLDEALLPVRAEIPGDVAEVMKVAVNNGYMAIIGSDRNVYVHAPSQMEEESIGVNSWFLIANNEGQSLAQAGLVPTEIKFSRVSYDEITDVSLSLIILTGDAVTIVTLPVRSYNGIRGSHHIGYYYVGYDVKNIFVPDSYQIVFINQNNQAASVGFHITDSGFISLTEETPYHANYGIRNILDDAKIIITEPDGRVLDTQEVEMELDFNRQVRTQQNVKNLIRSATGIIKAILYNDGQLQVIVNDVEFKTIRDVQDIIGMLGSTLFYLF